METVSTTESKDVKSVAPRIRSIAYPSYSITFCYDLVLKIHQTFGSTTFNTREEIAEHMGVSASHLMTQLSSCVQYGLLDIKNKEGYKPTSLFTVLYRPLNDDEKKKGLLECFANPELYKKLITQFNNHSLPSIAGLSTILLRSHKVSETASPLAARIFIENINDLGLVDSDNLFKLGGYLAEITMNGEPTGSFTPSSIEDKSDRGDSLLQIKAPEIETTTINYVPENIQSKPETRIIPINFKDGGEAQVVLPNKFTNENLARIVKILTAYIDD